MEEEKNENRKLTEEVLAVEHKDNAVNKINSTINYHIITGDYKQSHLLSYWFEDFSKMHKAEKNFITNKNFKKYKRGQIIQVNLGYNIGNELGGLHYCVVLNKHDNIKNGALNIIPLSSKKAYKKYHRYNLDLGKEVFSLMNNKLENKISTLKQSAEKISKLNNQSDLHSLILNKIELMKKSQLGISKFKKDSIVLFNQITTVSKQRIYKNDLLENIKLSNESLDLIDEYIKKLFTK